MLYRLFVILLLFYSSFSIAYTTVNETKIDFNQHSTTLKKALLVKNNKVFIPIFDLKKILPQLSIRYSHKHDGYFLKTDTTKLFIVNRSPEVWVNKSIHFFETPVFYQHSTLFVPFNDVFRFFNIAIDIVKDSKTNNLTVTLSNKQLFKTSQSPYATFQHVKADSTLLPKKLSKHLRLRYHSTELFLDDHLKKNKWNTCYKCEWIFETDRLFYICNS